MPALPRTEVLITDWEYYTRFYGEKKRSSANGQRSETAETAETAAAAERPAAEPPHKVWPSTTVWRSGRCSPMFDAPLSAGSPARLAIDGGALILGVNGVAAALARRLEAAGLAAYLLPSDDDPDRLLAQLEQLWPTAPLRHLFLLTGHDDDAAAWQDAAGWRRRRARGVIGPLLLAQRRLQLLDALPQRQPATLTAVTALGGDFGLAHDVPAPEGGMLCGLLKSLHVEGARAPREGFRIKVIDTSAGMPPDVLSEVVCRELAAGDGEIEVGWSHGRRRVVRSLPQPAECLPRTDLPRGGVWVVTGGARGITAASAWPWVGATV